MLLVFKIYKNSLLGYYCTKINFQVKKYRFRKCNLVHNNGVNAISNLIFLHKPKLGQQKLTEVPYFSQNKRKQMF